MHPGTGLPHTIDLVKITQLAEENRAASRPLANKIDVGADGNNAAIKAHVEKLANGLSSIFSVVQGAVVDVHADKTIRQRRIKIAGELHGVGKGLLAVIESMLDAVAESVGRDEQRLRAKRSADGVAAERKGEAGLVALK